MSHPSLKEDEALSEVNVIPLADLSLVLLIILMVLSPMIMQSMIKVQSSRASASKSQEKPEPPLILLVNTNGIYLNTVKMDTDLHLATALAEALGKRDDKTVMITADPAVLHGRLVSVLDLVKQQGAEKIALMHKSRAGK